MMSDIFEKADELDDEGVEILRDYVNEYGRVAGIFVFRQEGYGAWSDDGTWTQEEWFASVDARMERLVARLDDVQC